MTIELPLPFDDIKAICERLEALEIRDDAVMAEAPGTTAEDLRENEAAQGIHGLDDDQKHALVALMWIGRDDFSPADWDEAVREATERHETPTAAYLMSHPLAADEILIGLDAVQSFNEDGGQTE